jgi:hypothetical protein
VEVVLVQEVVVQQYIPQVVKNIVLVEIGHVVVVEEEVIVITFHV